MGTFFLSMFIITAFPALLDICADTYCVQENITSITLASETASSHRIRINHTLICKAQNGDKYECYDYVYTFDCIEKQPKHDCIVYGKYSRLLLDCRKAD